MATTIGTGGHAGRDRQPKRARHALAGSAAALAILCATALLSPVPAHAGSSWHGLKSEIYGGRPIDETRGVVTIQAPFRPSDVRAVPVSVEARLPEGQSIRSVTLVVDENPSPVAAKFTVGGSRNAVSLATKVRLNQESFVRAVVEADDGRLYMAASLVRFAGGQAACSAPPTGDPVEIAANMGKMTLEPVAEATPATRAVQKVRLAMRHPNHTGMALDQMTLLYIPLRMVAALEVRQGAEPVLAVEGSITLSENPSVEFDFRSNGADTLEVTLKDSDGAEWRRAFPVGPAS